MLQVRSFALPGQEKEANEFLATNKVANTNFNKDMIVVFVEDGIIPVEQEIADLREYISSMKTAQVQQKVALHVMKEDIKKHKAGSPQWQEINSAIMNTERGISTQDLKIEFVEKQIEELQGNGKRRSKK